MLEANKKIADLLWLDLEMTGLDPDSDLILEVAVLATDWEFNEIASYRGVIKNNQIKLKFGMDLNKAFWDMNPDSRDNLLAQNDEGKSSSSVERDLIRFIKNNFDSSKPVLLAGNSVHIDRQFIKNNWPKLDKKLHYRMLDVTAWKVVFEGKFSKKFAKPDAHRALEDIRGSIMELQYYLSKLK